MTSRIARALVLAVWGIAAPAGVWAQSSTQMKADVERQLRGGDFGPRVLVSVAGHEVTLSGSVPTLWAKREAVKRALKVAGVESVLSDLEIGSAENDASLLREVGKRVQRYTHYTVFDDVGVAVKDGVVTIAGRVTPGTVDKAAELDEALSRVRGVKDIRNQLQMLPVDPTDDRIRFDMANRIYSAPSMQTYSMADPPIHIIVEHGRVTLIGVVASELDRRAAYTAARQVAGTFSVDNQIRIPSELRGGR